MSTVTLSQPHCAMTSAENPEGIASHPLTAALPAFHRSFSLFSAMPLPFGYRSAVARNWRNLAKPGRGQQAPRESRGIVRAPLSCRAKTHDPTVSLFPSIYRQHLAV